MSSQNQTICCKEGKVDQKMSSVSCDINDQIFTTRPKTKLAKCEKLTVKSLGKKDKKLIEIAIF